MEKGNWRKKIERLRLSAFSFRAHSMIMMSQATTMSLGMSEIHFLGELLHGTSQISLAGARSSLHQTFSSLKSPLSADTMDIRPPSLKPSDIQEPSMKPMARSSEPPDGPPGIFFPPLLLCCEYFCSDIDVRCPISRCS